MYALAKKAVERRALSARPSTKRPGNIPVSTQLKNWLLPDKCDYEKRKPLQNIDEQLLCAGVRGDMHEIKFLHKVGADLEYRDHNDLGLAHFAAQRGDVKMMAYLNDHGAKPYDHVLKDGQTVVHIAARHGKLGLLKWMYNTSPNFNFDALDNAGANMSHYAVLGDKIDVIKWLYKECSKSRYKNVLKTPDHNGMDILSLSITLGHNDIRDFLRWVGTSKASSRVKSNFFRSVTAYNQSMLLDAGSIKLKRRVCLNYRRYGEGRKSISMSRVTIIITKQKRRRLICFKYKKC